jgi:hypothetical protein
MKYYFKEHKIIKLTEGIIYYNNSPLLELQNGKYDIPYLIQLLDQCKYISKTLPTDINIIGLQKIDNKYELIIL